MGAQSNIGYVRRTLMDTAYARLPDGGYILSTDGDTAVAEDWIESNVGALQSADAVGGNILLEPSDFTRLPLRTQRHYREDYGYQTAISRLVDLLDPDPHDPWPRHHHHFGASLACTTEIYGAIGGLPHVDCLEDVAFVERLVRADARLRHSPEVQVVTTARLRGRARVGLASQLREWDQMEREPQVESATFLAAYYQTRAALTHSWRAGENDSPCLPHLATLLNIGQSQMQTIFEEACTAGELHDLLNLKQRLWEATPVHLRTSPRSATCRQLQLMIRSLCAAEHQSGTGLPLFATAGASPGGLESNHAPGLLWRGSPELPA